MGKRYEEITDQLRKWMEEQKVFFVATAPLSADGHVNCSPKGLDSFRVLSSDEVVYQDLTGSGVETIAHLKENGRIVIKERDVLDKYALNLGSEGLKTYRATKNKESIDGMSGLE